MVAEKDVLLGDDQQHNKTPLFRVKEEHTPAPRAVLDLRHAEQPRVGENSKSGNGSGRHGARGRELDRLACGDT